MPDFLRYCKESGVDDAAKLGKEGIIPGKIMVGQIAATKGLEFDAVFLIGLNRTFTDTEFNQRLLYLGCSRAKHLLQLHWAGAETNILKRISRRGISTTRR
jgi:superfamily I DNA/RNA helicase